MNLNQWVQQASCRIYNYYINFDCEPSVHLKPAFGVLEHFERLKAINDDSFEHNNKVLCDLCGKRLLATGMWSHKAHCQGKKRGTNAHPSIPRAKCEECGGVYTVNGLKQHKRFCK